MSQKTTKKEALESVRQNPRSFVDLPIEFRADREIVLAMMNNRVDREVEPCNILNELEFVSPELHADRKVEPWNIWNALEFVSPELRADHEVVLVAIKNWGGSTFRYASSQLQNDHQFILTLLDAILKEDREYEERVVMEYKRRASAFDWEEHMGSNYNLDGDPGPDPSVLKREKNEEEESDRYAEMDDDYRREDDIERSIPFLEYVSPELWHDKVFVLDVVRRWPQGIEFASPELRADPELLKEGSN